jgi:hypothetical protein
MPNNILILGACGAIGWTIVTAMPLPPEPRQVQSRSVIAEPSRIGPSTASWEALATNRAPVPLVRKAKASTGPSLPTEEPIEIAEAQKQEELDKKAAKVAVEMDGYKRATIVGKASNGAWRAKAYRGATEVLLIVDGTGSVSME